MVQLSFSVGGSGSGKSTFVKTFDKTLVVCPDILRGVIGKNEEDQTCNYEVFKVAKVMTTYFLKQGIDVHIDATNLSVKNRSDFIKIARDLGIRVRAYCFNVPLDICLARNAARERKVPQGVIERQIKQIVWPVIGEVDEIMWVNAEGYFLE